MYETPRQKTSPAIYIALIASWVIILGGVWWMFFNQSDDTTLPETADEDVTRYFIGEQVLLEGTLAMADDISQFSHVLTTKEKMMFGVKSFDVALNGYTGTVQLKGEVTGFKQQMPIVQVADVIGVKGANTDMVGGSGGSSSYTYIPGANLGIDLSVFPGYSIKQMGNDVELYDGTNTKLITITPFVCTPGDATKDCTVIKNVLENAQRFTNSAGMVFLNFPETERWMSFDGNKQGYVLVAEPDVQLQTYASIFEIVDVTAFDTRLDEMKVLCKDINSRLATISTHETVIASDGSVKIGIDGSTSSGVAANCVIQGSLLDTTRLSLLSYTGPSSPESEEDVAEAPADADTAPTPPKEEDTPVGTTTSPTKVTVPAEYASWTTYPSVRGWTMYVERNAISYYGVMLTGAADVNCPYRLELSLRTNSTGATADSYIYECLPAGATTLKSQGYTTVGVATGVEFVRKDLTSSLENIDVYIQ